MNISRKVLGTRWLKRTYAGSSVLGTWTDRDGYVWFGMPANTTPYLYLNPQGVLAYYDLPGREWLYVNPLATHPWRTEL